MRQVIIFSIVFLLVPLAFFSPFAGLLSYVWIAYVRPHEWAYAPNAQISLAVAVSTLAGYVIFELTKRSPKLISNWPILLLWLQLALAAWFAEFPAIAQGKLLELSKTFLIALLLTAMVDSEKRVRWLLLCTVVSIGFLAFRSNLGILLTLGQTRIYGPGGAFEDNNDYALLLNVAAPIAYFTARGERRAGLRRLCYSISAMMMVTVVFTLSRGGFLGLCAVALCISLKSRHRLAGVILALGLGALTLAVAPERVAERLGTIRSAGGEDESARMRLDTWKVSLSIIADHPVFGVGPRNMLEVYDRYGKDTAVRVAHNSYLQMAVDGGLPALALFLSLIGLGLFRLRRARSVLGSRAPDSALIAYSHGLEAAIIGYLVSATFLSRHDLELLYEVAALAASFGPIVREAGPAGGE